MGHSDDDEESAPQYVDNYYFEDADENSVSLSVLPVVFDGSSGPEKVEKELSLRGVSDGGLQKVYEHAIAWKLGFEAVEPQIFVLTKEKRWICLKKPRRQYLEETVRRIMIVVRMLHYLRRNLDATDKSVWEHLNKVFSIFEFRPCEADLRDHISLVELFREKDERLGKSQVLLGLLNGRHVDRSHEDIHDMKHNFIVEDYEVDGGADEGGDDDDNLFDADSVCAICDNGGDILCCEGKCLRSFHATREAGEESQCRSLGFTPAGVQAMKYFYCKNCEYQQHQCFACGKLGSSDKSKGAEVFRCVIATCGHFYHPKCIAELLFPDSIVGESERQKKIAEGESFVCPAHSCVVCKGGENKNISDLQFAVCRRCPRSYHRKCLPREISFGNPEDDDVITRAWEGLLPCRILLYCLKHEIDDELNTPKRNHIKFPSIPENKKAGEVNKKKIIILTKKKTHSDELPQVGPVLKPVRALKKVSQFEESKFQGKPGGSMTQQALGSLTKTKSCKDDSRSVPNKDAVCSSGYNTALVKVEEKKEPVTRPSVKQTVRVAKSSFSPIDTETEKRIRALIEKNEASITVEDIIKMSMIPSTHAYCGRNVDRTITTGKVEGSIEAVQTALRKLEAGCTVADAKAVCDPNIVRQLSKWGNKLKVYLAPFLHGMRYTSYGRHFTKVEKLNEIVDTLQWYVQDGDTMYYQSKVVDFCCGANDFSQLMKEKLDVAGKKCNFKNYDLIRPKNDFNFEQRDWMKVGPKELPSGSKLIMGLNPPFGVKAALANKFIDKALTFKPKLLILIVPKETERLDKKITPYDLIWEDSEILSGKSFYLPGSVDVNDKQMEQWNVSPPLLYLWSRHDWTSKHKDIALRYGHKSTLLKQIEDIRQGVQLERSLEFLPEKHAQLEFENSDCYVGGTEADMEVYNKVSGVGKDSKKRKFQKLGDAKSIEILRRKKTPEDEKVRTYGRRQPQINDQPVDKTEPDYLSDMSISPEHANSKPMETSVDRMRNRRDSDWSSVPYQRQRENSLEEANKKRGVKYLSNMGSSCIYPFDSKDSPSTRLPCEPVKEPEWVISDDAYLRSAAHSQLLFGTEGSIAGAMRCPTPPATEGMVGESSHLWQDCEFDNLDSGTRNLDDYLSNYSRDDSNWMPCSDIDGYGRYPDTEIQIQPKGFQGMPDNREQWNQFSQRGSDSVLGGHSGVPPPKSYACPIPESGTSRIQRYAPNLAETNYVRPEYHAGNIAGNMHATGDMSPDPREFATGPSMYPYPGPSHGWFDG